VRSTDNEGQPISGLKPYREHNLVITLYQAEMENLEWIAESLMLEESAVARSASRFAGGGVSHHPLLWMHVLINCTRTSTSRFVVRSCTQAAMLSTSGGIR